MAEVENEPQDEKELELAPAGEAGTDETPEGASDDAQESTPDEQPEVEASEGEEPPAEKVAETPEPETEPFGFTADRRRFEVPGAALVKYKDAEGNPVEKIVLDKDAWNRFVQPNLRDQATLQKREQDHKRQVESLDPERNETVIRARALLGSLEDVLKSEESLTAFLQNFESNKELWALKADKAASDARLTGYTTQETEQQQAQRLQETTESVLQDIPGVISGAAEFVTTNWNVPVDQRAMQAAQQQITENIGAYYRFATAHDAQTHGVEEGQLVRDDDAVIKTVQRFATLLAQGNKVETVKANNKAALGVGKSAPKTVSAKGSPGAAEKPKTFKNKEEYLTYMGLNS